MSDAHVPDRKAPTRARDGSSLALAMFYAGLAILNTVFALFGDGWDRWVNTAAVVPTALLAGHFGLRWWKSDEPRWWKSGEPMKPRLNPSSPRRFEPISHG